MSTDRLSAYRGKRDFARTPEPAGTTGTKDQRLSFVVHKHAARRLHYDLRLEWHGVLKSWAVTRGPSMDPHDKRLAVEVEDHPIDYGTFEGLIPPGEYGGGVVQIWDAGYWGPLDPGSVDNDLNRGELKFVLAGERLRGGFVLVRMKPRPGEKPGQPNWLLIKEKDSQAKPGEGDAVLRAETSVRSGRTMDQIGAGQPASATKPAKAAGPPLLEPAAMPRFVDPQLCRLVTVPPGGEGWLHELKLDGYRIQLRVERGHVTLRTRTGLDWSARFPAIAEAASSLPDGLVDGEVVALDQKGAPDFNLLQATLGRQASAPLVFFAFDLLHDGRADLRALPLTQRKAALRALIRVDAPALRMLEGFDAPGDAVLASACKLAMEGIVSKRRDSPYRSGRGDTWTKAKCRNRDEFIVGGWTVAKKGRGIGALLLGAMREGKLVYQGRMGTGFARGTAEALLASLKPLQLPTSPFAPPKLVRVDDVTWVKPVLVVEVAHGGTTEDGLLRHASFQGVRQDQPAKLVTAPPKPAAPPAGPGRMTRPERVLWPATADTPALTKADLAAYFTRFANRILADVAGRPLSVVRAPDGLGGDTFMQRHAMAGQSPLIGSVAMPGQKRPFMRIDDLPGLLALAQMSVLELHVTGAHADAPEIPDRLVFDFDPAEGLDFGAVIDGAQMLRRRLALAGLQAFPRVTGGKGVHLVVPLASPRPGENAGWPEAKQFCRLLCAMLERDMPDRFTTNMAKRAREGRVFLDYLRNDLLSTAVATWSPRARSGAPIARPLSWAALKTGLSPNGLKLNAALADRLPPDPWKGFGAARARLADAISVVTRA